VEPTANGATCRHDPVLPSPDRAAQRIVRAIVNAPPRTVTGNGTEIDADAIRVMSHRAPPAKRARGGESHVRQGLGLTSMEVATPTEDEQVLGIDFARLRASTSRSGGGPMSGKDWV
jgi:hypothetical protein